MRMFVAIDLDDRVKQGLSSVAALVKQAAKEAGPKLVKPDQAHLTLAFMADVPSPQSERVIAALAECYRTERSAGERFGDFVDRVGTDRLNEVARGASTVVH